MIDGAWAAAAALPVLLLIASFLMAYQNIPDEAPGHNGGITQIFRRIFAATYLVTFTRWELVALAPLLGALVIAIVAALRRDQIRRFDVAGLLSARPDVIRCWISSRIGVAVRAPRAFSGVAIVMTIAGRSRGALVRTLCVAALAGLIGQTIVRSLAYKGSAPTLESRTRCRPRRPGKTFVNADLVTLRDSTLFA